MALVVIAASVAACGAAPSKGVASVGSTTTPGAAAQTGAAGALRFANCMRSNGVVNYPDPSSNGAPQSLHAVNPSSPTFLRAYAACRKDIPNGGLGPPAPTAAQLRFALAFARCVRKHGFPQFPEPLTTYGPGFTLGRGEYFPLNGTSEVGSAAFTQAAKSCGVQPPPGSP